MLRTFLPLALGLSLSAVALAQARPPIPSVVLDHMNDLDRRCVAAGGRAGQGRFVVAQDFTGDRPLQERIDLIKDADMFLGLSSGLSWLAWCCSQFPIR